MPGFKSYIYIFILAVFGFACSKSNSLDKKFTKIPKFDQFTECITLDETTNADSRMITCNLKNNKLNEYEIEDSKFHLSYKVAKAINEEMDLKVYIMEEWAYDCKNKESILRDIKIKSIFKGKDDTERAAESIGFNNDWKPNKSYTNKENEIFHHGICPPKKGYTKIGNMQVDLKNVIRSGSIRNVSTYNAWDDFSYTTTVDCKKLLFGLNSTPDNPIKPKSNGGKLYKKVC